MVKGSFKGHLREGWSKFKGHLGERWSKFKA